MTVLKVIGIILLFFLLIGFLRIGAIVSFGTELCVRARVGALKLTLYPKKEKAPKKPKEPKQEEPPKEKTEKKPKKKKAGIPKPTLEELLDLIRTALSALGATIRRTCRRVRIDPLDMTVVFGGDDPADVARLYGVASSAMYALMPRVEERFDVPDPSLHLRMNYDTETTMWDGTSCEGTVGLSLRVCDLFAIAFTLAIPMLKWFLRFKKAHKHDMPAHKGPEAPKPEENQNDDTEERIA